MVTSPAELQPEDAVMCADSSDSRNCYSCLQLRIQQSSKSMGARGSIVHYGTATRQRVPGSIPVGVIGFLNGSNPFSRTMAQGSTLPLN
jgi:hypothetical protein